METKSPQLTSLTVEEAVALLINFDYIPTGFSLLDMTGAFYESADVEHNNALLDHVPEGRLDALLFRKTACMVRHSLAISLTEHLNNELDDPENTSNLLSSDPATPRRVSVEGLMRWASDNYGIGVVPAQVPTADSRGIVQASNISPRWEDVEIRIYADYLIGYSINKGQFARRHFREIGLMGERKSAPNALGATLIRLSHGKKFPTGKTADGNVRKALTDIRNALKKLTGISSDPFYSFNEGDGWKPRFKLIDALKSADERARDNAIHVAFDEERHGTKDYEDEGDEAQDWIDKNG